MTASENVTKSFGYSLLNENTILKLLWFIKFNINMLSCLFKNDKFYKIVSSQLYYMHVDLSGLMILSDFLSVLAFSP